MPDELDAAIVRLADALGKDPVELRQTLALLVGACVDGSTALNALEALGLTAHLAKLAPHLAFGLGSLSVAKKEPD